MKKRMAYARIAQESNCFSPVLTTLRDFEKQHFVDGDALEKSVRRMGVEAPGFLRNAELSGFARAMDRHADIDAVGLFSAWAVPGGPLSRECFDALVNKLTTSLTERGPFDGVMLSLHGAMNVRGLRDPDTEILRAVQRAAPGAKIAATYDLHANMTEARVRAADISVAYHTNPHRDHVRAGRTAGDLLARTVKGTVSPVTAWRSLPMILGGGRTVDFLSPVREIFSRLKEMNATPNVLSANLFMVHPWNDDPALGWSTLVTTDGDPGLADRLADELADRAWAVRHDKPPHFPTADEAIAEARSAKLARKLGVVCFSDASDVVAAGGTGENPRLLAALLRSATDMLSYVPFRDPEAVASLWDKSIGDRVSLSLGGRLHPEQNEAVAVSGVLKNKRELPGFDRVVLLDLGHVQVVVTEGPALALRPRYYSDMGLDPWKADIIVTKSFFPFRMFFLPMARKTFYVRTEGVTDLDAALALEFDGPVFPKDDVKDWREGDRRRRPAR